MDSLSVERVKIIEQTANSITGKVPLKILKIISSKLFGANKEKKL